MTRTRAALFQAVSDAEGTRTGGGSSTSHHLVHQSWKMMFHKTRLGQVLPGSTWVSAWEKQIPFFVFVCRNLVSLSFTLWFTYVTNKRPVCVWRGEPTPPTLSRAASLHSTPEPHIPTHPRNSNSQASFDCYEFQAVWGVTFIARPHPFIRPACLQLLRSMGWRRFLLKQGRAIASTVMLEVDRELSIPAALTTTCFRNILLASVFEHCNITEISNINLSFRKARCYVGKIK